MKAWSQEHWEPRTFSGSVPLLCLSGICAPSAFSAMGNFLHVAGHCGVSLLIALNTKETDSVSCDSKHSQGRDALAWEGGTHPLTRVLDWLLGGTGGALSERRSLGGTQSLGGRPFLALVEEMHQGGCLSAVGSAQPGSESLNSKDQLTECEVRWCGGSALCSGASIRFSVFSSCFVFVWLSDRFAY